MEVIIYKVDMRNPMAEVKELLRRKSVKGLINIRETKNGDIALTCRDKTQKDLILKLCEENKLDKRSVGSEWPLLRLLNCEKGLDDEQIERDLSEDTTVSEVVNNYKIRRMLERIVIRRPSRRGDRENIVVQLHPAIFKALIRKGRANLGLISSRVEEYLDIPVCYKCGQFGHKAQKCENEPICIR